MSPSTDMNSRQKGKRGELELAKILREHGFAARRGQQFKGGSDSPDVTGIDGVHIECKRVEKLNVYEAMEQSVRDAGELTPVVIWRRNGKPWLVIMRLNDYLKGVKNDND